MNKTLLALAAASSLVLATAAASAGVPDQASHVNAWHGVGSDHQGGNDPGDTAKDRHNFGDAAAGKSGHNPTDGSNQDPDD
jgi:hypothetical protein